MRPMKSGLLFGYASMAVAPCPRAHSIAASRRAVPTPDQFTRLEKTRNEALAIGHLLVKGDEEAVALAQLGQQRSGSLSAQLFDLHLGAEASRRQVAGGLKDFAVLHATHQPAEAGFTA